MSITSREGGVGLHLNVSAAQAARGLSVAFIEEVGFDEGADGIAFFRHHCVGACVRGFGLYIVYLWGSHDGVKSYR